MYISRMRILLPVMLALSSGLVCQYRSIARDGMSEQEWEDINPDVDHDIGWFTSYEYRIKPGQVALSDEHRITVLESATQAKCDEVARLTSELEQRKLSNEIYVKKLVAYDAIRREVYRMDSVIDEMCAEPEYVEKKPIELQKQN